MFRKGMTLLTAVVVLWHTVVGCCGHHHHGDHDCGQHCGLLSAPTDHGSRAQTADRPVEHEQGSHDCCHCGSRDPDETGLRAGADQQPSPGRPSAPEPCRHQCSEGRCVIGTPGRVGPELTDSPAPAWLVEPVMASRAAERPASDGPVRIPPAAKRMYSGTLRTHLALHILTV